MSDNTQDEVLNNNNPPKKKDPIVQYIIVRRDLLDELKWPTGSVISQGCHAAVAGIIINISHTHTYIHTFSSIYYSDCRELYR
jgi:hypothetical protein